MVESRFGGTVDETMGYVVVSEGPDGWDINWDGKLFKEWHGVFVSWVECEEALGLGSSRICRLVVS